MERMMRFSLLVQLLALAALVQGCAATPQMTASSASKPSQPATAESAATPAKPDAAARISRVDIDLYCSDLLVGAAAGAGGESPARLYERSDEILRAYWAGGAKDAAPLAEAVTLACRARPALPAGERNGSWAWNEHHLGEALLLLGAARDDAQLLKLALLASANAAASFDAGSEGWAWARYNTGRSAAELFTRDGTETHKTTALQAFRDVSGTTTAAAMHAGQQLAALGQRG
jgi:hypothetical protein